MMSATKTNLMAHEGADMNKEHEKNEYEQNERKTARQEMCAPACASPRPPVGAWAPTANPLGSPKGSGGVAAGVSRPWRWSSWARPPSPPQST